MRLWSISWYQLVSNPLECNIIPPHRLGKGYSYIIVVAAAMWGLEWTGMSIHTHSDNQGVHVVESLKRRPYRNQEAKLGENMPAYRRQGLLL
jgi:hypothetical protein